MSNVPAPRSGDQKGSIGRDASLPESPKAQQIKSEESLLSLVLGRPITFSKNFLLGWIQRTWVSHEAKTRLTKEVLGQIALQAKEAGIKGDLQEFNKIFLAPLLSTFPLEDLKNLQIFTSTKEGSLQFINAAKGRSIREGKKAIAEQLDLVTKAMQKNPEGWRLALTTNKVVSQLIGDRFSADEQFMYIDSWMRAINKMNPEVFKKRMTAFQDFLKEAEGIQLERPKVYTAHDKKEFVTGATVNLGSNFAFSHGLPFLTAVIKEIVGSTILENSQPIQENIAAFYVPRDFQARTIPSLSSRNPDISFSLSREFHTPPEMRVYEGGGRIDFNANIDLSIRDEKTGATRHLSLALPLPLTTKESMLKKEVEVYLSLLNAGMGGEESFRIAAEQSGLSEESAAKMKEKFNEWSKEAETKFAELIFDFNATDTRPAFSYAREIPAVKAAIENPKSLELAVESAKTKNLFVIEKGKLSLLPPEIKKQKAIGEISNEELTQAQALLLGQRDAPISMQLPIKFEGEIEIGKGTLSFESRETSVTQSTNQWIELDTIIEYEGIRSVYSTIYEIQPGETREERLKRLVQSPLFQGDLLLAKAEYMGKI